jgi:hypothetical protein
MSTAVSLKSRHVFVKSAAVLVVSTLVRRVSCDVIVDLRHVI